MFKYLPLLWANLRRKPLRTWLTIASIVVAFLLFGLMQTLRAALTFSPDLAGVDRLVTMSSISIINPLPQSYLARISSVAGVQVASSHDWFGGIYKDDRNQIAAMAVEPEKFFDLYVNRKSASISTPVYQLPEEQKEAWLKDRTAAIVGHVLAERFGWKVGDTIPLRSNIYTKADGSNTWMLKIAGIFTATSGDNQSIYFNYDYFNEARTQGKDTIGWVAMRIEDPDRSADIARTIDAMFANSSAETKTATERAFVQSFANQMGNIGALVTAVATAVFFTMLLVTANTMGQSIRERLNEIAVMKTLGFSSFGVTAMVIAEAVLVTAIGGIIGLAIAAGLAKGIGKALEQFFPVLGMPASAYIVGAVLIVGLGVLAAVLPSMQAGRLKIVDALRKS